jgi:hypothetical protein
MTGGVVSVTELKVEEAEELEKKRTDWSDWSG